MLVVLRDNRIVIKGFRSKYKSVFKDIEYTFKGGELVVYKDWALAELIDIRFPNIQWSKGAAEWLQSCRQSVRFVMPQKVDGMYLYQLEGAGWLFNLKRAILADDPGLGKTLQAIMAAETAGRGKVLVLCKNPFTFNWKDEIKKWIGVDATVAVAQGRQRTLKSYSTGYLIVGWKTFIVFPELLRIHWDTIIADEAHKIKNPKTKTFNMFSKLKSTNLYMLTATPFGMHNAEVWTMLNSIDSKCFSSYWRFYSIFVRTLMIGAYPKVVGAKNVDVYARVVGKYLLRRTVEQCFDQLPPKQIQRVRVDMTPTQRKVYDQMRLKLVAELEGEGLAAPTTLVKLVRMRQIASTTATLWERDESGKLDAATDIIEETPGQVVVCTDYRNTVTALKHRLDKAKVPSTVLMGGMDYEAAQKEFQSGRSKVFIMTRGTGGESLNLDNADTMIILERPWNPNDELQLEGRVIRPARPKHTMTRIIYLEHPASIDTAVAQRMFHRQKITNQTLLEILSIQGGE